MEQDKKLVLLIGHFVINQKSVQLLLQIRVLQVDGLVLLKVVLLLKTYLAGIDYK